MDFVDNRFQFIITQLYAATFVAFFSSKYVLVDLLFTL